MTTRGKRRKNRTSIGSQFAPRRIEILKSPAYRVLSLSAHKAMAYGEIELAAHAGCDNGKLPITYGDLKRYGIDTKAIAPAIRELVALGFWEVTEKGRPSKADWRFPSKFRLTYRNTDTHEPTDEWRKVTSVEQALAIAQAARANKDPIAVERALRFKARESSQKNPESQGCKSHLGVGPENGPTEPRVESPRTALGENIPNYLDSRVGGRDVA